jgi:ComF family protein
MPVAQHDAPCPYCVGKGTYPFERVIRLGPFRDPLSQLIYQTKYHRKWPLAEFLADRLMAQARVQALLMETDVLVPVPLHRFRQIARGYNQADVIARRLRAEDRKLKIARPAVRLRNTETQTHQQSRQKRAENLRDAFGLIDGRRIKGKHVVIIDDVMTTGATMQSLGRTLLQAEPASLCALVVAMADPKGRDFETI